MHPIPSLDGERLFFQCVSVEADRPLIFPQERTYGDLVEERLLVVLRLSECTCTKMGIGQRPMHQETCVLVAMSLLGVITRSDVEILVRAMFLDDDGRKGGAGRVDKLASSFQGRQVPQSLEEISVFRRVRVEF